MEIMATVSSKHQVTLPADIRRLLGVEAEGKVVFVVEDGNVQLKPAKKTKFSDHFGSIPSLPGQSIDFEKEIAEAMDEEAERIVRELDQR